MTGRGQEVTTGQQLVHLHATEQKVNTHVLGVLLLLLFFLLSGFLLFFFLRVVGVSTVKASGSACVGE